MHKSEDHHHTPEQIGQYLRQAVKLVDKAELSTEDRAVLLPEVIKLLASKQLFYQQTGAIPDLGLPGGARH